MRTDAVFLGGARAQAAVPATRVQVYLAEADVPWPFEKVALLTAESRALNPREGDLVRAMQNKAASLGATGLILLPRDGRAATVIVGTPPIPTVDSDRQGRAVAIRPRGPAPSRAPERDTQPRR
jgi:hypothetical protein